MLEANHKIWAETVFKPYIFRLLKKSFSNIYIFGDIPEISQDMPIILAPNHSTWWDGFFVYLINKLIYKRKFYIMILEEQLSQYKFFTKLGGYSINQNSPKSIIESINYTTQIIDIEKNPLITIFPQGVLEPQFKRPFKFGRGIDKIIEKSNSKIAVLPLYIKTEFYKEQYPDLYFKFGDLRIVDKNSAFAINSLESELETLSNEIDNFIINNDDRTLLFEGKSSVSDRSKAVFNTIKLKN